VLHKLSRGGARQIHSAIDDIFENLKVRALGPQAIKGKRLYVGFRRDTSIPGIFEGAAREEGIRPDLDLLDSLTRVAGNYIDGTASRAKAKVTNAIDSWLREQSAVKKPATEDALREKLRESLDSIWKEMTTHVETILDTEASQARNVSLMDGIVKVNALRGIDDPVVYFVIVRDTKTCQECKRLHLLDDMKTPRVWRLSEVGHDYHQRGEDNPKIGGLHPHCRCTMVTLLPGFGFKDDGGLGFIAPGHDEYEKQRGMEKSEALVKSPVRFNPTTGWTRDITEEPPFGDMQAQGVTQIGPGLFVHKHGYTPHAPYTRYYLTSSPDADFAPDHDEKHYPVLAVVGGDVQNDGAFGMTSFAVHPAHTGKGYGSALLAHVAQRHGRVFSTGTVSDQATAAFNKLSPKFDVKLGAPNTEEPHEIRVRPTRR